jgi:uncharacterized protein (DUF488 family)
MGVKQKRGGTFSRDHKDKARKVPVVVLTIGHSTRTLETFIKLLQAHEVQLLVDVRTIPRSRHYPQFNQETLPGALRSAGIKYAHLGGLGGLRHPRRDSPNTGWRNPSFRGYADYLGTAEFEANLERVKEMAKRQIVAIMCAEAVPWRCHRSLISDALLVQGIEVRHITGLRRADPHTLTPWAKVDGTHITYPATEGTLEFKPE